MADFKMPDLGGLMEAARRMQADMARVQDELGGKTVDAAAGGGMVTATVNGRLEVMRVKVDPAVVDPKDVAMLEDLIVAAVNQALVKAKELAQGELAKVAGPAAGMLGGGGLPPMF